MITTLIVAFIVLAFVAIRFRGPDDLLWAKLRPRHRDRKEEIRNKLRPFLIMPVNDWSVTSLPVDATKRASLVQNTPLPIEHRAANDIRTDSVVHEEWLPPQPRRALARETARDIPVTPLADAPVAATMVFQRPADQLVQILPGRFKVISGDPRREDIHFIGQIGAEARLMIGRNVGAPHEVVTLQSPTVSRRHAQMQFADGYWIISNLSETNPIIVNDETLDRVGRTHRLSDGDCVELGEVVLEFHAH